MTTNSNMHAMWLVEEFIMRDSTRSLSAHIPYQWQFDRYSLSFMNSLIGISNSCYRFSISMAWFNMLSEHLEPSFSSYPR